MFLKHSLLWFTNCSNLHVVCFFNLNTSSVIITIIETVSGWLREVWSPVSTLMHDFDVLSRSHTGGSTLRSISHNSYLSLWWVWVHRLVIVTNCNCWCDWIIITTNCVLSLEIVFFPIIQRFWNHLKSIAIYPKLVIGIETIHEEPIDHNILSSLVLTNWYFICGDMELNKVIHFIQVDSYVCAYFLSVLFIFKFVRQFCLLLFLIFQLILKLRWSCILLFVYHEELSWVIISLLLWSLQVYFTIPVWFLWWALSIDTLWIKIVYSTLNSTI